MSYARTAKSPEQKAAGTYRNDLQQAVVDQYLSLQRVWVCPLKAGYPQVLATSFLSRLRAFRFYPRTTN